MTDDRDADAVYAAVSHYGRIEPVELALLSGVHDARLETVISRLEAQGRVECRYDDPATATDPPYVCLLHPGAGRYSFRYVVLSSAPGRSNR
jgi:hypothetical protein